MVKSGLATAVSVSRIEYDRCRGFLASDDREHGRKEMLDERSKRRRERLKAMTSAAPGIEAEAISEAVYSVASSLVRSAVESAVEAEAEVLAAAVAKAVAKALPPTVDVEVEGVTVEHEVGAADVAEDLAQMASEYMSERVETLVKSTSEGA